MPRTEKQRLRRKKKQTQARRAEGAPQHYHHRQCQHTGLTFLQEAVDSAPDGGVSVPEFDAQLLLEAPGMVKGGELFECQLCGRCPPYVIELTENPHVEGAGVFAGIKMPDGVRLRYKETGKEYILSNCPFPVQLALEFMQLAGQPLETLERCPCCGDIHPEQELEIVTPKELVQCLFCKGCVPQFADLTGGAQGNLDTITLKCEKTGDAWDIYDVEDPTDLLARLESLRAAKPSQLTPVASG